MEVSVENTGVLGRKLTFSIPAQSIEEQVSGRIKDLGGKVRLKGFRPGRIPYKVLQQRFGAQVRQEVVGELIQQSFSQAVTEHKLRPVDMPNIDAPTPKANEDLQFSASFEVFPELEELDVAAIKIERPVATVGDADVDEMIETLRQQRATWEDVERSAEAGDLVFFHYSFEGEQGRFPEEGESRAGAIIGNGAFDPEFEDALVGLAAGEDKDFELTFAENARETQLAGQKGKAQVRLEKVQHSELPEVNDDFAASFGVSEGGVEQFKEDVRQNLTRELKQGLSRLTRSSVLDKLVEAFPDIDMPETMISREAQAIRAEAVQRAAQAGLPEDQVPAADTFNERAEQRVRAALLVSEVARHGEIEIDGGRVRDLINEIASTYEDPQAVVQMYYSDHNLLSNIQNVILEEQAVDWILEKADVTDLEKSFSEIMKPDTAA